MAASGPRGSSGLSGGQMGEGGREGGVRIN